MSHQMKYTLPPGIDEYFEYYHNYIKQVPDGDYHSLLVGQIAELRSVLGDVNENDAMKLHSPYTWTLKQVIGHLIDGERIFADRLHRFASGDFQELPGMDQDPYIINHDYLSPTLSALLEELIHLRQANVLLLRRIKPEAWDHRGVASNHPVTVRALAYILVGHINHHLTIVRKRLDQ
ncbi:MAG TPA: DinB family protein [Gemmatales bacterium]|nr:DinB family protein [Gemmatales bacterium]